MMKTSDRFMIVDDDPISNMLCKLTIQRCFKDANIKLFTEPEAALIAIDFEYSKKGEMLPTIMLLDINMPSMTGWEFLDVFKDYSEHILQKFTIFFLSSSVDQRDEEKAKSSPHVSGFISKPLTSDRIKGLFISDSAVPKSE